MFCIKHDSIHFPEKIIKWDIENPELPLLQSKTTSNSFSLSAIVKNNAHKVLKSIIDHYDKAFLTDIALKIDSKGKSAIDYAEECGTV